MPEKPKGPEFKLVTEWTNEDGARERGAVPFADTLEELQQKQARAETEALTAESLGGIESLTEKGIWEEEDVSDYFTELSGQVNDLLTDKSNRAIDTQGYADVLAVLAPGASMPGLDGRTATNELWDQVAAKLFPDVKSIDSKDVDSVLQEALGELKDGGMTADIAHYVSIEMANKGVSLDTVESAINDTSNRLASLTNLENNEDGDRLGVTHTANVVSAAKALYKLQKLRDTLEADAYGRSGRTSEERVAIDTAKGAIEEHFGGKPASEAVPETTAKEATTESAPTSLDSFEALVSGISPAEINDELQRLDNYENPNSPDDEMAAKDARNALKIARKYSSMLNTIEKARSRGDEPTADQLAIIRRSLEGIKKSWVNDLPAAINKVANPDLKRMLKKLEQAVRELE